MTFCLLEPGCLWETARRMAQWTGLADRPFNRRGVGRAKVVVEVEVEERCWVGVLWGTELERKWTLDT